MVTFPRLKWLLMVQQPNLCCTIYICFSMQSVERVVRRILTVLPDVFTGTYSQAREAPWSSGRTLALDAGRPRSIPVGGENY